MDDAPLTDLTEATEPRLTVRCACGWEVAGNEDEVVASTIEHGRRLHNMVATREEVLAMARSGEAPPE